MDWNLFFDVMGKVSVVLGTLLMLSAVVGGLRSLYLWWSRPRLTLHYHQEKEIAVETCDSKGSPIGHTIWTHVTVGNDSSRATIQNCRCYLTNIWELHGDSEAQQLSGFNAKLPLQWAHREGVEKLELIPKETANVDVFNVWQANNLLNIITGSGMPTGTIKHLTKGRYKVRIRAFADNAKAQCLDLIVEYKGGFAGPSISICKN